MTEQPAAATSPTVVTASAGQQAPPPPASIARHESPLTRAEDWFRERGGPGPAALAAGVADELKPALQDHFAGIFALAAEVLGKPELKAIAPAVLELAESAARIGGLAL